MNRGGGTGDPEGRGATDEPRVGPTAETSGDLTDAGGRADDRDRQETGAEAAVEAAGRTILRVDVAATAVFAIVSALAAAVPDPVQYVLVPLDLVLFTVGCGAFLWAYAIAVGRSRYEVLSMAGVFFPGGDVAPPGVARTLRAALAVQVVVAVAVAAVRPFTALAFGVLVPMLGLGLMALWGARHGRFPPKSGAEGHDDRW